MNKNLLARFLSAWLFSFLLVSQIWGQDSIRKKRLDDGVDYYYRIGAAETKPWFFQQVENLLDVIIRDKTKLPFGKSVAFLVGVSEYKYLSPQLPFVKNDIEDMRSFLLNKGGFDEVYVAWEENVDRDLIGKYMAQVFRIRLKAADRLLFYYSGHGADAGGETGYMQFANARSNQFYGTQVMKIKEAEDWCSEIKISHLLVIFDCCASGLAFTPKSGDQDYYTQMIATLSKKGSRAIITAGTAKEKTFEVKSVNQKGNGVFTRAFLNAIATGNADRGKDGFITIDEIMAQVKTEVAVFSQKYKQSLTPRIWPLHVIDYDGTFIFMNPEAKSQNCTLPPDYYRSIAAEPISRGELVAAKGILELTAFVTGKVWIDDREVGDIESGDVKEYYLLVGKHLIEIRNEIQKVKKELEIKKGSKEVVVLRLAEEYKMRTPRLIMTNTESNIRRGPGTSYKIYANVIKNTPLTIIQQLNNWSRVLLPDGEIGWIFNENLKEIFNKKIIAIRRSEIHEQSNTQSALVGITDVADYYTPLSQKDNWYRIGYKPGFTGWISKQDVYDLKYPPVYVNSTTVDILRYPEKNADRLAIVKEGVELTPIDKTDEWLFIELPRGDKGWIPKNFVDRQKYPRILIIRDTQAYEQPTAGSMLKATLAKDDQFLALDKKVNWYKILLRGSDVGWVYSAYVQEIVKGMLMIKDDSFLRMGPGLEYRKIVTLHKGEHVKWLTEKNGWSQIQIESSEVGWVMLEQAIDVTSKKSKLAFTTDKATIHKGPGSHYVIVARLEAAIDVNILGTNGDWYHVQLQDGKEGYIRKELVFEE